MSRWLFLILIGCCGLAVGCGVGPSARLLAWDGLDPDNSNRPQERSTQIVRSKPTVTVAAKVEQPSDKGAELAALPNVPRNGRFFTIRSKRMLTLNWPGTSLFASAVCRQTPTIEPDQSSEVIEVAPGQGHGIKSDANGCGLYDRYRSRRVR